jgi:hypothetical protein
MTTRSLHTAAQVAALLGLSARQVRHLARLHSVGQRIGGAWLFRTRDIEKLRGRKTKRGRPAKNGGRQ